jgi:hypothetical protein
MFRGFGVIAVLFACGSSFAEAKAVPDRSSSTSMILLPHGQRMHVAQSAECGYSGAALPIHCACINQLTGALCIRDASCQSNEGPYGACSIITCQQCVDVCKRGECIESSFDR